jgi:hypothetical protein
MNEKEYFKMEEDAATGTAIYENLKSILAHTGCETVAEFGRAVDKYGCGAAVSVLLHDGTWRHSDELKGVETGNVRAIMLTMSIPDSCAAPTRTLDLIEPESPEAAVQAFEDMAQVVTDEADEIMEQLDHDKDRADD